MGAEEKESHHQNPNNQERENPWKTLSTETLYSNPWITLRESKVINPAGNPGIYGVVHFKNRAIAIVPLDDELHTWIVGQYRYTLDSFEWEVPEGGAPLSEDPLDGAKRELQEEVGLIAERWQLVLETQLSNSVSDEIGLTYVARDLREVGSNPEETELLHVKRIPFSEAVDMVMKGQIKDGLSVASILKVKFMLDQGMLS
ncbi:MAG: NUDIX domain-containing protein [Bacteroidota bacterium]